MEQFKKYLPFIVIAIVGLYLLTKLRGGTTQTRFLPQTQFQETQQVDPLNEIRLGAFRALADLGIRQTEIDVQREIELGKQNVQRRAIDVGANAQERAYNLVLMQRAQDTALQQGAIDRYYSSRRSDDIFGSINTALASIFGSRGGTNNQDIFRTPSTFPSNFFGF